MANADTHTVVIRDNDNDDNSSVSSWDGFENVDRRRSRRRHHSPCPPEPVVSPMPTVDGKAPDVLYRLRMYNRYNRLVEERLSSKPFKRLPVGLGRPGKKEGQPANDNAEDSDDSEDSSADRPVLQIVHTVDWSNAPKDVVHVRRRPRRDSRQIDRPITSVFDGEYYADPAYTDEEDCRVPSNALAFPTLEIHSKHLLNALRAVIKYYPGLNLTEAPFQVKSPYIVLYHHRKELAEYRDNQPETHSPEYASITAKHIDVLLRFLEKEALGVEISREEERHRLPVPVATFKNYWLLLKPGSIVYAKTNDVWEAFVISKTIGGGHDSTGSYSVACWYLESNGTNVNRFMSSFEVPRWLGNQAINSLPVVPEAFWREDLEAQGGLPMRESLVKLGKMYWDLLKRPTYMEHEGPLVNSSGDGSPATKATGFMCGRVICDAAGFDKYYDNKPYRRRSPSRGRAPRGTNAPVKDPLPLYATRCGCEACDTSLIQNQELGDGPFPACDELDPVRDTPTDDMVYLLCKKTIPGFLLAHRQWGHLRLSSLRPVQTDKDALKYLVVDDEIKSTVKALIGKYSTTANGIVSPWGTDFVKNKGEGRIFLLHGTPGVGKTCTAECIAELTSRPLLALTSGDLGTDDYVVEDNLNYFLELGQRYGAIVLLDEADIYLERRRGSDIWRNGLVSIFLRALEYYRGALFLTTNRVRIFDPAFLSRIHVALHYKTLRDEDRERIWLNSFDRLERESDGKVHVSAVARDLVWSGEEVRRLEWNGREIRNAMQTALALAEFDSINEASDTILIGEKHIKAVIKMSKEFRDSVHEIRPPILHGVPPPPMAPYVRYDSDYD